MEKRINHEKTIQRYIQRLRQQPRSFFLELEGKYLSSFELYSTVEDINQVSAFIYKNVPALHLLLVAREKNVHPLGLTSERSKNGLYLTKERQKNENIVFVGKFSYFAKQSEKTSKYALLKSDHVYYNDCDTTSDNTFMEMLWRHMSHMMTISEKPTAQKNIFKLLQTNLWLQLIDDFNIVSFIFHILVAPFESEF